MHGNIPEHDWVLSGKEYDIERWYGAVAELTPETFFFDLNCSARDAIIDFYALEFNSKQQCDKRMEQIKNELHALGKSIQKIFDNHSKTTEWFIRLSCRSPKDGIPANFNSMFTEFINRKCPDGRIETLSDLNPEAANILLSDIFKLHNLKLKVLSAHSALHLLLTSERIFRDLTVSKQHNLRIQVALRKFENVIDEAWEFRCFIFNSVLTAISQYNQFVVYPQLKDQIYYIQMRIHGFVQQHVSKFPFQTCVMDVALVIKRDNDGFILSSKVIVIEFNPFDTFTGPSLFDYVRDAKILKEGPLSVRIREHPFEGAASYCEMMIEEMYKDVPKQRLHNSNLIPRSKGMTSNWFQINICVLS